jgi:hypothetical protein
MVPELQGAAPARRGARRRGLAIASSGLAGTRFLAYLERQGRKVSSGDVETLADIRIGACSAARAVGADGGDGGVRPPRQEAGGHARAGRRAREPTTRASSARWRRGWRRSRRSGAGRVRVAVERGEVGLFGSVAGFGALRCAERNAELVRGVRLVIDQLVLDPGPKEVRCLAPRGASAVPGSR